MFTETRHVRKSSSCIQVKVVQDFTIYLLLQFYFVNLMLSCVARISDEGWELHATIAPFAMFETSGRSVNTWTSFKLVGQEITVPDIGYMYTFQSLLNVLSFFSCNFFFTEIGRDQNQRRGPNVTVWEIPAQTECCWTNSKWSCPRYKTCVFQRCGAQ